MTSTGKGRRGTLGPAIASAVLGLVGALLLLTPASGQGTSAAGEGAPTLAQPTPAASASASVPDQPAQTSRPADPASAVSSLAGEQTPSYALGQEPWRAVVTGFATDFTQPTGDWAPRVTRWTSDYLTAECSQLAPDRVPAAGLRNIEVVTAGESTVDVIAVYDTGFRLVMRVENSVAGWKITKVEPAE